MFDHLFIQSAAGKNFHVLQSRVIQQTAGLLRQHQEITGVQTYRLDLKTIAHSVSQIDDLPNPRQRIVGIDQEHGFGEHACKRTKGRHLILMGLNKTVRHGSGHRHPVDFSCQDVGRGRDPAYPKCSGGFKCGINAMHPAGSKVDHRSPFRRRHHPLGLGGLHGLHMDLIHHEGFNELRFGHGCHDFQQRFIGKHRRPFGHRIDVSGKPKVPKPGQKPVGKEREGF